MAFAPDNAVGLHAYVVEKHTWGRTYKRIEYAHSLKDAKASWGWTRELYTTVAVRRARVEDLADSHPPEMSTLGGSQ